MKQALELLIACTAAFPPREGSRHALFIEDGKLVLCLADGGDFQQWHLDDRDAVTPIPDIIAEMRKIRGYP